jgi:hypothetical protein
MPLAGIIATEPIAAPHAATPIVSSVAKLTTASWWISRGPSVRLARTLGDYQKALELLLRHANSLIFIDPYIDPTNAYRYGNLMRLLEETLMHRSIKPLVELHRAAWYGGENDKRPRVSEAVGALQPGLSRVARAAGISFDVFLWDEIHDRYLITDLIGISLPYGFGTTRAPNSFTTWARLGRADRDSICTISSNSSAHCLARRSESPSCRFKVSLIWAPIVKTGSKEVIGSWKIIATSAPRRSPRARQSSPSTSLPAMLTLPEILAM